MPPIDPGSGDTSVNKTNFLRLRFYRGGKQTVNKSTNENIIQQVVVRAMEKNDRVREGRAMEERSFDILHTKVLKDTVPETQRKWLNEPCKDMTGWRGVSYALHWVIMYYCFIFWLKCFQLWPPGLFPLLSNILIQILPSPRPRWAKGSRSSGEGETHPRHDSPLWLRNSIAPHLALCGYLQHWLRSPGSSSERVQEVTTGCRRSLCTWPVQVLKAPSQGKGNDIPQGRNKKHLNSTVS